MPSQKASTIAASKAAKGAKKPRAKKTDKKDAEVKETKMPGTGNILPIPVVELLPADFPTGDVLRHRIRVLKVEGKARKGPVVYWMSRDQRSEDNWALLWALELATQNDTVACVVFNLCSNFLNAPLRHYQFMLDGLKVLETKFRAKNIPFLITVGDPLTQIPALTETLHASAVVTDYSPLRISQQWKDGVCAQLAKGVHFYEVDAHNVVPVWLASDRQEWSAATFRRRQAGYFSEFFTDFPNPGDDDDTVYEPAEIKTAITTPLLGVDEEEGSLRVYASISGGELIDWAEVQHGMSWDDSVRPVTWIQAGEDSAHARMKSFLTPAVFKTYHTDRNVPDKNGLSNLSPFLHYGHISAQRVAWEAAAVKKAHSSCKESFDAFFEELVCRRELSDNFCHFQPLYDSYDGIPPWAKVTLELHAKDKRAYVYTEQQLEQSETHDDLWNAAQREMVVTGKMHGYIRMYWVKKILEWTKSPREAIEIAIRQNDKYELDGRDPSGYVGCLWGLAGVHDRAWGPERQVFGKIRFMNYDGCKRKFSIPKYISSVTSRAAVETKVSGQAQAEEPQQRLVTKQAKRKAESGRGSTTTQHAAPQPVKKKTRVN